jgi:hypothetical protein
VGSILRQNNGTHTVASVQEQLKLFAAMSKPFFVEEVCALAMELIAFAIVQFLAVPYGCSLVLQNRELLTNPMTVYILFRAKRSGCSLRWWH